MMFTYFLYLGRVDLVQSATISHGVAASPFDVEFFIFFIFYCKIKLIHIKLLYDYIENSVFKRSLM